jgi:hypothetical protein
MTNTPESDTMKTLLQTALDNGAMERDLYDERFQNAIVFRTEAQLLATFNAWSAQQTPIAYLRFYSHQYLVSTDFGMDVHEGFEVCEKTDLSADGTPAFPVYTVKDKPL